MSTALEKTYRGTLTTHYDEEGYFARMTWRRDAAAAGQESAP